MTTEKLLKLSEDGKVVDIWKVADIILDMREENEEAADAALASLNISEDGPKIILGEKIKDIVERYQESTNESD